MEYHHILRHVYWVIMTNEKVMKWKFLHCFGILYYKKIFGLPHYSLHPTHYTTILINDTISYSILFIFISKF